MIAEESSTERSVNSGVICGAVTRMIRKAKNAHQREGDGAHRDDPGGTQRSEERYESLHGIPLNRRGAPTRQELPSLWLLCG